MLVYPVHLSEPAELRMTCVGSRRTPSVWRCGDSCSASTSPARRNADRYRIGDLLLAKSRDCESRGELAICSGVTMSTGRRDSRESPGIIGHCRSLRHSLRSPDEQLGGTLGGGLGRGRASTSCDARDGERDANDRRRFGLADKTVPFMRVGHRSSSGAPHPAHRLWRRHEARYRAPYVR